MNPLGGFNWLDISIFVLAVVSLAIGFAQGMLRQVIALAALYIATILGSQYYASLSGLIKQVLFLQSSNLLNAIAFFLIVIFVWLLITWLAYDAYRNTRIRLFPLLDQLGGAFIALITFAVMLVMILPVMRFMVADQWVNNENVRVAILGMLESSRLTPTLLLYRGLILNAIAPWMPNGIPSIFEF